jgi:hypothetical protein
VPTYSQPDTYVILFRDGTLAEYLASSGILEAVDSPCPTPIQAILPDWIQEKSSITLFLNDMVKPQHGRLYLNSDNEWVFCSGNRSDTSKGILLPDLSANCHVLLETGQLFQGHAKFPCVYQACHQAQLQSCVLRHVSAHGLQSLIPPASLKHHSKLSSTDQLIWDEAYTEEYDGLQSIPTW